jgi:uncharacterized protein (DUF4415 family)
MKKVKKRSRRNNTVTMTVTEKDYERELTRGVEPQFAFKPGKHRFVRGGFLKRHNLSPEQVRDMVEPENVRAAISIKIPVEVLEFFKAESAKSGRPYQTRINDALRAYMDAQLTKQDGDPVAALRQASQLINTVATQIKKKGRRKTRVSMG